MARSTQLPLPGDTWYRPGVMNDPFAGLGEALVSLRKRQGLSQPQVEEAGGLSLNSLSRYELGKSGMKVETLGRVVRGLGIGLGELAAELAKVQGREPPEGEGSRPRVGGLTLSEETWGVVNAVFDEAVQVILREKLRAVVQRHQSTTAEEE